jgi:hypothetical protein
MAVYIPPSDIRLMTWEPLGVPSAAFAEQLTSHYPANGKPPGSEIVRMNHFPAERSPIRQGIIAKEPARRDRGAFQTKSRLVIDR